MTTTTTTNETMCSVVDNSVVVDRTFCVTVIWVYCIHSIVRKQERKTEFPQDWDESNAPSKLSDTTLFHPTVLFLLRALATMRRDSSSASWSSNLVPSKTVMLYRTR